MVYKTVQSVQKIVRIGCKSFLLQHILLCTCRDNIILSSDSGDTHQRNVGFEAVEQKSPLKTFDNQKYIYIIFCLVSASSMESKE